MDEKIEPCKTMIGRTKEEWLSHLDLLFLLANPGEDIPPQILLYAWPAPITAEDLQWAGDTLAAWNRRGGKDADK